MLHSKLEKVMNERHEFAQQFKSQ